MADVVMRAPHAGDAKALAADMRPADVAEVLACGETDLVRVVQDGIDDSALCWTIEVDGQVAGVVGVVPLGGLLSEVGVPWMLGTPLVQKHRRMLVRISHAYIRRMLGAYPHLLNFVHTDNAVAVRWLKRTGFELQPAVPYGPLGALFHRFDLKA